MPTPCLSNYASPFSYNQLLPYQWQVLFGGSNGSQFSSPVLPIIVTNDLRNALPCFLRVLNYRRVGVHIVLFHQRTLVHSFVLNGEPRQFARTAFPTMQIRHSVSVLDDENWMQEKT